MENARYKRGLELLGRIDGASGQKVVESLGNIAPDFARLLIEFPFGDIYSRPGLSLQKREIATVAALTALGHCAPQLQVHIAGLECGLQPRGDCGNNHTDGSLCRFSRYYQWPVRGQ